MNNVALLTMDNLDKFECYDSLISQPLKELGWKTCNISWRNKQVDWNDFDAVIIRSPWDYQDHCDEFLLTLEKIEKSNALLANCMELVNWNINKNYLRQLEKNGVTIIPTLWHNQYSEVRLSDAFEFFKTDQLIIKPCVSANADDTYRLKRQDQSIDHLGLGKLFKNRDFMLQPFMRSVIEEGEYSLFFFNHVYSHSIVKTPKKNDFRVQEEHGGHLKLIEPSEKLVTTASQTLDHFPHKTLYARLDFVRSADSFLLMEAELIEPSLYFNMDADSPARFARAFVEYFNVNALNAK